jgi:hypothetical protein
MPPTIRLWETGWTCTTCWTSRHKNLPRDAEVQPLNRNVHSSRNVVIEDFRNEYNHFRSHSNLGYASPAQFAAQRNPSPAPVGLRPSSAGDGQKQEAAIASTTLQTNMHVAQKSGSGQHC